MQAARGTLAQSDIALMSKHHRVEALLYTGGLSVEFREPMAVVTGLNLKNPCAITIMP